MEKKIVENNIHAAVFCSPHNPCGRVWERWELEKAMELFQEARRHGRLRRDLVRHHSGRATSTSPRRSVTEDARERTVALYAPSKTFNLAGLIGSYHIIYNKALRDRVDKESSLSHYNSMNVLSMHALIGAYSPGGQRLGGRAAPDHHRQRGLRLRLYRPALPRRGGVRSPRAPTCCSWTAPSGAKPTARPSTQVQQAGWDVGVAWQDGRAFHGPCHIRMNLALPLSRVQEAFDRLQKYVFVD